MHNTKYSFVTRSVTIHNMYNVSMTKLLFFMTTSVKFYNMYNQFMTTLLLFANT